MLRPMLISLRQLRTQSTYLPLNYCFQLDIDWPCRPKSPHSTSSFWPPNFLSVLNSTDNGIFRFASHLKLASTLQNVVPMHQKNSWSLLRSARPVFRLGRLYLPASFVLMLYVYLPFLYSPISQVILQGHKYVYIECRLCCNRPSC